MFLSLTSLSKLLEQFMRKLHISVYLTIQKGKVKNIEKYLKTHTDRLKSVSLDFHTILQKNP